MKLFSFFKTPGHRQFQYVPRFYDPDKEDLDARVRRAQLESQDGAEAMKSRISSGLRRQRGNMSARKRSVVKSNMIILGAVIILIFLVALLVNSYLPRILEYLD